MQRRAFIKAISSFGFRPRDSAQLLVANLLPKNIASGAVGIDPSMTQRRESEILSGDGKALSLGPFPFGIFDARDIEVWIKPRGDARFSKIQVSVSKISSRQFDSFTVRLPSPIPSSTEYVVRSARTISTYSSVGNPAFIDPGDLALEVAKQSTVLQELRRDLDRALLVPFDQAPASIPGAAARSVVGWRDGYLVNIDPNELINLAGVASAEQGAKADSALQTGNDVLGTSAEATLPGAVPYLLRHLNESELNLLMFAAPAASSLDVSDSVQALIDAATSTAKTCRIPSHPEGLAWRINNTIRLGEAKLLFDPSARIECHEDITMFFVDADKVLIDGGGMAEITHYGGGIFFDTNQCDDFRLRGLRLNATLEDRSTKDIICISGANSHVSDLHIGNFRSDGYAIRVTKKLGNLAINNRISDVFLGGTGKGIIVTSEDKVNRPEGLTVRSVKSVLTGKETVRIETAYSTVFEDGVFDQSSGIVIHLAPKYTGIRDITINNCYLAAAKKSKGFDGGIGVYIHPGDALVDGINVTSNEIAYCSYGIAAGANATSVLVTGNSFDTIDQTAIQGVANDWTLRDNEYRSVGKNIDISDSSTGGSITIDNERFDPRAKVDLPPTITYDRWQLGRTFGQVLRRVLRVTVSNPRNEDFVYIPHGLARPPSETGLLGLSVVLGSGDFEDLRLALSQIDDQHLVVQVRHESVRRAGTIIINVDVSV